MKELVSIAEITAIGTQALKNVWLNSNTDEAASSKAQWARFRERTLHGFISQLAPIAWDLAMAYAIMRIATDDTNNTDLEAVLCVVEEGGVREGGARLSVYVKPGPERADELVREVRVRVREAECLEVGVVGVVGGDAHDGIRHRQVPCDRSELRDESVQCAFAKPRPLGFRASSFVSVRVQPDVLQSLSPDSGDLRDADQRENCVQLPDGQLGVCGIRSVCWTGRHGA